MSGEPIAKRTRQSASITQHKIKTCVSVMQTQARKVYDGLMSSYKSSCDALSQEMDTLKFGRKVMIIAHSYVGLCDHTPNCDHCDCKRQQFQFEHRLKKFCDKLKTEQKLLWDTRLLIESMSIENLHSDDCIGSDECLLRMQRMLKKDPLSLERKQFVCTAGLLDRKSMQHRCSPLHHAIRKAHVKCVKFLLERGAKVTSVTTKRDSMFDSVYDMDGVIDDMDGERLDILKLLFEYGVSSMLKTNVYEAEWALLRSVGKPIEEISLLLHHGAIMDQTISRNALVDAWKSFNLPAVKLLLLHHRNRLNFGAGSPVLCPIIIQRWYYTMVLPGVPSNECHEKVLEALQLYKSFGGKFPVSTTEDSYQDLMQFLKSYKHRRHFNDIKSEIKALISTPLSLQEISRLAVRKNIRRNYVESVKYLPLPEALQSFLRFDDVTFTKLPEKFDEFGDDEYDSSDDDENDANSGVEL